MEEKNDKQIQRNENFNTQKIRHPKMNNLQMFKENKNSLKRNLNK